PAACKARGRQHDYHPTPATSRAAARPPALAALAAALAFTASGAITPPPLTMKVSLEGDRHEPHPPFHSRPGRALCRRRRGPGGRCARRPRHPDSATWSAAPVLALLADVRE